VLAQASNGDEDTLVRSLDELWQRRLVREQGTDGYDFSHDKIREVAYIEISVVQRRRLHRQVAQALETIYISELAPVSAQLAMHYEQAGLSQPAISYYQRAAEVAERVYANQETIELLTKALALLETLPASQERDEKECELHLGLGVPLVALKGYGAIEVLEVYTRARALYQQLGKAANPPVLRALALAYIVQSKFRQAHELGLQLLSLAQSQQDPILRVEGHYVLGVALFWLGEFMTSRSHLEQALAYFNPNQRSTHLKLYTQDPEVICLSRLALGLWYLGHPDQAVQKMQEGLTLAHAWSHPFSLAYILYFSAILHCHRRDIQATLEQAEAAVKLCSKQQLGFWLPQGMIVYGWALAKQGEIETGMAQMRQGLADLQATGARYVRPFYLALLAELSGEAGDVQQGLTLLDEALALVSENNEPWCESELVRLKGELLLQTETRAEAERYFQQAVEIARRQAAKSLELRAVMNLCRLWQEQGRHEEAHGRLAEIYDWFTEGFETADLKAAKLLLQELA
jgi:predicted ATPase